MIVESSAETVAQTNERTVKRTVEVVHLGNALTSSSGMQISECELLGGTLRQHLVSLGLL